MATFGGGGGGGAADDDAAEAIVGAVEAEDVGVTDTMFTVPSIAGEETSTEPVPN